MITGVHAANRDVVLIEGPDSQKYLQGQLSQDVDMLEVGASAWTMVLQPQGKVDAWGRISRLDDERWALDIEPGFGDALVARLKMFLLRVDVALASTSWDVLTFHGTEPAAALIDNSPVTTTNLHGAPELLGPALAGTSGLTDADAPVLDDDAATRLRVARGIPAMGSELGPDTIPAEAGIVDISASFTKGCYTGQELVARVDSRGGNTPRKLRIFSGPGAVPDVGTELCLDDTPVATLTTTVSGPDDAGGSPQWLGLGYLKRSALEATELEGPNHSVVSVAIPEPFSTSTP